MWWIEILEKYWNQLRDFNQKYGMLSFVILAFYFVCSSSPLCNPANSHHHPYKRDPYRIRHVFATAFPGDYETALSSRRGRLLLFVLYYAL